MCTTELNMAKLLSPFLLLVANKLEDLYPLQLLIRFALNLLGRSEKLSESKCFKFFNFCLSNLIKS